MKIKTLLFIGVLTLLLSLNIFSYPRDEGALNKPSVSFANLKDGYHRSYGEELSKTIQIEVQ